MSFQPPSSLLMAPMAAKQGAHIMLNTRNAYPAIFPRSKSAPSTSLNNISNVPTMFSFAIRPVMVATVNSQLSPNPRGTKMYLRALPRLASIELPISSSVSRCNCQSNDERNHTSAHANSMNVPAFFTNAHPLSSVALSTLYTLGA